MVGAHRESGAPFFRKVPNMGKNMSKKQRKLREEMDELATKKTRGFMQAAIGVILFVLFLIVRQVLVSNNMIDPEELWVNIVTYALAVVAAGFVGIGSLHYSKASTRIKEIEGQLR